MNRRNILGLLLFAPAIIPIAPLMPVSVQRSCTVYPPAVYPLDVTVVAPEDMTVMTSEGLNKFLAEFRLLYRDYMHRNEELAKAS
jgi:hypothetical protein